MLKVLPLAILAIGLGSCVLESDTPLIPEDKAELLLGSEAVAFAMYELRDGSWKKQNGDFTFTPEGKHYRATDGKDEITFSFMTTANNRWAIQGVESGKSAAYLIAEKSGEEILLRPLDCKTLRDAGTFTSFVTFTGDDCKAMPGADPAKLFAAAAQLTLDSELKMVRE